MAAHLAQVRASGAVAASRRLHGTGKCKGAGPCSPVTALLPVDWAHNVETEPVCVLPHQPKWSALGAAAVQRPPGTTCPPCAASTLPGLSPLFLCRFLAACTGKRPISLWQWQNQWAFSTAQVGGRPTGRCASAARCSPSCSCGQPATASVAEPAAGNAMAWHASPPPSLPQFILSRHSDCLPARLSEITTAFNSPTRPWQTTSGR